MRGTCCGVWPPASASAGRESIALGLGRTYGEVTARQVGGSAEAARRTRRASAAAMLFFFPIVVAVDGKEARAEWTSGELRWMGGNTRIYRRPALLALRCTQGTTRRNAVSG